MIKKSYSKTGRSCKVTFELPPDVNAEKATICGDFNEWNGNKKHKMKRLKDGSFSLTVSLKPGNAYRFRYLLDEDRWENDWSADGYAPNPFGSDDSITEV